VRRGAPAAVDPLEGWIADQSLAAQIKEGVSAMTNLPSEVRFIRLGKGRCWQRVSFERGEIHAGWNEVSEGALNAADREACRNAVEEYHTGLNYRTEAARKTAIQTDFNQLMDLIEEPERFVWVTIADGRLYWCTVKPGVTVNPKGESDEERGHFWLTCKRQWSDRSLKGKRLVLEDLPGAVGVISRFAGTVAKPRYSDSILRAIRGERPPEVHTWSHARKGYISAVEQLLPLLHWRDFELLTELIFARGGWLRTSTVGRSKETIDIEAEHPETGERALIQVKMAAGQRDVENYVERWRQTGYDRLFFVVAMPRGVIKSEVPDTHVWGPEKVADLIVRRGLADWVAKRAI
jgi:hypothetical protein